MMLQAAVDFSPLLRDMSLGLAGLVYLGREAVTALRERNGHSMRAKMDKALAHLDAIHLGFDRMREGASTMHQLAEDLRQYMVDGRKAIVKIDLLERDLHTR